MADGNRGTVRAGIGLSWIEVAVAVAVAVYCDWGNSARRGLLKRVPGRGLWGDSGCFSAVCWGRRGGKRDQGGKCWGGAVCGVA